MQHQHKLRAPLGAGAPVAQLRLVDDDIGERGTLRHTIVNSLAAKQRQKRAIGGESRIGSRLQIPARARHVGRDPFCV
jgi:hypothetical protein